MTDQKPDAPGEMTADRLRDIAGHVMFTWPLAADALRAHADELEKREKAGMGVPNPDANETAARIIREWQNDYATGDEVSISLLQESIAGAISAAYAPRAVDVPVEGMLSAEEYEGVLQKLSNEAKYGHSGFASDSVMCNCSVHRLWNHMRSCERALRDSRNLLREAEARGDEWRRVANEREEALREAQAKLQTTRKNALEEAALIVDGCNLRGPYDAIGAAKLIRGLYGYGSELREALAQQPPQADQKTGNEEEKYELEL